MEITSIIIMDGYKKTIENFYNKQALTIDLNNRYGSKFLATWKRQPYIFVEKFLRDMNMHNKKVLDIGCGSAFFSLPITKRKAILKGIDLSDSFLTLAKKNSSTLGVDEYCEFLKGDMEKLDFDDNEFDIVLCIGSLSYVDYEQTFKEASRVTNKDGVFIIIDTLGHNPILNLNRKLKQILGSKIRKQVDNILKLDDYSILKSHFRDYEINFFDLSTILMSPFGFMFERKLERLCDLLGRVDEQIFKADFMRKMAFKVVCIARNPIKD